MTRRVAVVGGGLAGITAALACADAGCDVTLYEARARLGGLTYSFSRGGLWVDNGQHVFLRCCTAYQRLLTRLGSASLVELQARLDIPLRSSVTSARLHRNGLGSPLHLSGSLLRFPWLSAAERVRFAKAAVALRGVQPDDPATDSVSFLDWLSQHGQSERAVDALWDLVTVASLNARARDTSLALAATVFQRGLLGQARAGDIGWPLVPLQELHGDAASRVFGESGVHTLLHSKVYSLTSRSTGRGGWVLGHMNGQTGGADVVDVVILAVPPTAAEHLLPAGALGAAAGWAKHLGGAPIVNLHVVLDRTVLDEPFVAGVVEDTPGTQPGPTDVPWVFDRTRQSGLAEGQYLAVSLSAADGLVDLPTAVLRQRFWPVLCAILPGLDHAKVRDFFVTRERAATFRPAPGCARWRQPARTGLPGLFLAGAWTDTGWPATMEGAVRSGENAARLALSEGAEPAQEVAA